MIDITAITLLGLGWGLFTFGIGVWVGIKLRPDDQPRDDHGRFKKSL